MSQGDHFDQDDHLERLSRDVLGPALYEICQRGGYSWNTHGRDVWLLWGDAVYEYPEVFEQLFPMPECFGSATRTRPFPSVPWLAPPFLSSEDWDLIRKRYRELKEDLTKDSEDRRCVLADKVPGLITWRDGLEKQLQRVYERIQEPLVNSRSVLKVWYVAARHSITHPEGGKTNGAALGVLDGHTKGLWAGISRGAKISTVENWQGNLHREGVPEELAEAQWKGIMYYLKERDELLEEALPLHAQRWGLEEILRRALIREPLMSEDEMEEVLQQEERENELKQIHGGPARDFWDYAYELYWGDNDLNRWKDVCEYIWKERTDLGLPGKRHKNFDTFESARTAFQSSYGVPQG